MDQRNFSALHQTKCERKVARKNKKKLKAVCRLAHAQHKKIETVIQEQFDGQTKQRKKREKRKRQRARKRMEKQNEMEAEENVEEEDDSTDDENLTLEQFEKEAEEMRRKRLGGDFNEDDREIRKLEAKLSKSKKRKLAKGKARDSDEDELERVLLGDNRGKGSSDDDA